MPGRYRVSEKSRRTADGIVFDSMAEMERYRYLKLLEQCGEISNLSLQPVFTLVPAYEHPNRGKIRALTYRADFRYTHKGNLVVEDVKGVETDVFKIKRKILEYQNPDLDFRVVKV